MSAFTKMLSESELFRPEIPATKTDVENAEKTLNLTFSDEYRKYLTEYGCAAVFGHEFTGFSASEQLDVVNVTLQQKKLTPDVPHDWYVIEEANFDGIIIWQDSQGFIYMTQPNRAPQKIADSFLEYVLLEE